MVSLEEIKKLTSPQLKQMITDIKKALQLTATGKNRNQLAEIINTINSGNSFNGKRLLSSDGNGLIQMPQRIKGFKTDMKKKREELKQILAKAKRAKNQSRSWDTRLERVSKQLVELDTKDKKYDVKMQVYEARVRQLMRTMSKNVGK
jgi:DNA repair ATPase RecN